MPSHLLWFRLPKGRVWHVAASGSPVALCGQSIPTRGERQPKRPPFGARPCPDCDAVELEVGVAMAAAKISHRGLTPKSDNGVNDIQPEVTRPLTLPAALADRFGVQREYIARIPTDPEDDGDLPDLLGQDGEVTVR